MSYQPLYATLTDGHGTVHTHCLRGRQTIIDGWVNTDIGELMRFYIRHNGERLGKKQREPIEVTGRIVFPESAVITCEKNEVVVKMFQDIPKVVLDRLEGKR